MERTRASGLGRNASTSRVKKDPNLWILLIIVLILAIAYLIFEFDIRQNIEGPGHLRENTEMMNSSAVCAGGNTLFS